MNKTGIGFLVKNYYYKHRVAQSGVLLRNRPIRIRDRNSNKVSKVSKFDPNRSCNYKKIQNGRVNLVFALFVNIFQKTITLKNDDNHLAFCDDLRKLVHEPLLVGHIPYRKQYTKYSSNKPALLYSVSGQIPDTVSRISVQICSYFYIFRENCMSAGE